jgi:Dolichyl-phosphate-mannose-protein mannosyltransferase
MGLVSNRQSSSDPPDAAGRPSAIRKWAPIAAVILLAAGAYVATAYVTGTMGVAAGDDWAYSRIAHTLYSTGHIHLVGWNEVSLVGQLLWTLPFMALFGSSLEVLHWSIIFAAAIGLFASYSVFRHFLRPGPALFGTALLALFPTYSSLATTYMTDTVAFAAQMVCLALGLSALESRGRRRWVLLLCSVGVGLFGFTVRETAIVAPVAVLGTHFVVAGRNERTTIAAIGSSLVLLSVAFIAWRRGLPGSSFYSTELDPSLPHAGVVLGQAYFALALSLLPALIVAARTRSKGVIAIGTASAFAVVALIAIWDRRHGLPFDLTYPVQDLWTRKGAESLVDIHVMSPLGLPNGLWAITTAMTLTAGVLLAIALAHAAKALRTIDAGVCILAMFGLLYAVILSIRIAQTAPVDQRHFLPLTVPLLVLALWHVTSLRSLSGRFAFGVAAAVGVLVVFGVLNEQYFAARQWSLGKNAVTLGTRPQAVDAGFAWTGLYSQKVAKKFPNSDAPGRGWENPIPWYGSLFPDSGNCMLVSRSRLDQRSLQPVAVRTYTLLPGVKRHVWLYRNAPACDAADG